MRLTPSGAGGSLPGACVLKIGGSVLEDRGTCACFTEACALSPDPLVIVHGGGPQTSHLQKALGRTPRFVDGRRFTSPEDLEIVEMSLSVLNKTLVRALQASGVRAAGVSGCDGGLLRCERVAALGSVGVPSSVDAEILATLLQAGFTPVVSPVSLGPGGDALNVNADDAASAIAAALRARRLIFLSDVPGILSEGKIVAELGPSEIDALSGSGCISGGMLPKIRAALAAADGGVAQVLIAAYTGGPLESISGTRICSAPIHAGARGPDS